MWLEEHGAVLSLLPGTCSGFCTSKSHFITSDPTRTSLQSTSLILNVQQRNGRNFHPMKLLTFYQHSSEELRIKPRHCAGSTDTLTMDCKASLGKLKAPEKTESVAHGPDLAIDDFLARAVL